MPEWSDSPTVSHAISPWSLEAIGPPIGAVTSSSLNATVSTAWPSANLAVFVPFYLDAPMTVARMFVNTGATAAGSVDLGVYSWGGTRLVSSGATAQGTINVNQFLDVTDTIIGPGDFWLALMATLATSTVFALTLTTIFQRLIGMQQMATSGSLPATATFAAYTSGLIVPVFGISDRAS